MNDLQVRWWPIERPRDYPKNARKWSAQALDKVGASIKAYGFRQPVVVDREEVIIIGHLRRAAARTEGFTEIPVHVAHDLTPQQVRGLRLMDNRSHSESSFDLELLGPELKELQALDFDLRLSGFDDRELDEFLSDPDDDRANLLPPVPDQPATQLGDLWLCGEHRVLCGDSTDSEAVSRLLGGHKADTLWTDPPFGVSYVGKTRAKLTIQNDGAAGLRDLLDGFLRAATKALAPSSPFYIAHPAGPLAVVFARAVDEAGWRVHQGLVWVKDSMVLGHSDYHYQHEPILYGFTPGDGRPGRGNHIGSRWVGDHSQVSIFEIPRPKRSEEHPTQKPIQLIKRCILNSTPARGIVFDPFCGSGSTVIACEDVGFRCRAIEIDPVYCDVVIVRWQEFTSAQATLEGDGRTFAQIKEARAGVLA